MVEPQTSKDLLEGQRTIPIEGNKNPAIADGVLSLVNEINVLYEQLHLHQQP